MKIAIVSINTDFSDALQSLLVQAGYEAVSGGLDMDTTGFDAAVLDAMPENMPSCRSIWIAGTASPAANAEILNRPFAFASLQQWLETDSTASIINIANGKLDKAQRLLHGTVGETALTDKEIDLLEILLNSGDDGVERKKLLTSVWGYNENAETTTLETHIYRLRRKFHDIGLASSITNQSGMVRLEFSGQTE